MKIKDCMCNNICYCKPDATIRDVAKTMNNKHIGCMPVCDNSNKLVGIITDRDIVLRAVACDKGSDTKVSEIMTINTISCESESELMEASRLMKDEQIRRIPVTDNGKLVGILSFGDLAKNQQVNNAFVGHTAECICVTSNKNAK